MTPAMEEEVDHSADIRANFDNASDTDTADTASDSFGKNTDTALLSLPSVQMATVSESPSTSSSKGERNLYAMVRFDWFIGAICIIEYLFEKETQTTENNSNKPQYLFTLQIGKDTVISVKRENQEIQIKHEYDVDAWMDDGMEDADINPAKKSVQVSSQNIS
jgi:hypothetical protein